MNVMNAITARRKADEVLSDSRLTGLFSSIKSLRGPHQVESGSFRSRRRRRRRRDQPRFVARRRNFVGPKLLRESSILYHASGCQICLPLSVLIRTSLSLSLSHFLTLSP